MSDRQKPEFEERGFDAQIWRVGEGASIRGSMVKDLIESDTLIGMARTDVLTMLDSADSLTEESLTYWVDIGIELGGAPWMMYLSIKLDSTGLVEDAWLAD